MSDHHHRHNVTSKGGILEEREAPTELRAWFMRSQGLGWEDIAALLYGRSTDETVARAKEAHAAGLKLANKAAE